MANIGALIKGKLVEVGNGVYLERSDARETVLEEWLRGAVARIPPLPSVKKPWHRVVAGAAKLESTTKQLNDLDLVACFRQAGAAMSKQGFTDELVIQSFAAVREASRRSLGMRPHDVQLMGGWSLLKGYIGEMATGEGKTLVAGLGASTVASTGAAVHVVTVNDYLAERDAEQNLPLFKFLGLSVGIIQGDMDLEKRRTQYACDIAYVSNKELVFDYLKDRISTQGTLDSHIRLRAFASGAAKLPVLLRGLHMAIVDEADSVLIDEARTPLIISETQPDELGEELYQTTIGFAKRMVKGEHFELSAERRVYLNPVAEEDVAQWSRGLGGVWQSAIWRRELIQKAVTALHCFHRDQHYILAENKIQIVDEFTGRVMPDCSWERGLHQMIEAKEGAEITGQRKTLSQMTYQRFFRRYLLLSGMTGTAKEIAVELRSTYDLQVLPIPTHKPSRRKRLADSCWSGDHARWLAVAERAIQVSGTGRPVLVGTRSVEASEKLSLLLNQRNVDHALLNARQDKTEAEAVARGGERSRITVATNMAGRGTDIKLSHEVSALGGLHVILTEFHESARVDRQLFGRCARQGEAGTTEAVVCLDDEVFVRFGWPVLALARKATAGNHSSPAQTPAWLIRLLVALAQIRAERFNRNIRLQTMKQDRKTLEGMGFTGKNA
jgi:preprotein translocase subunit SecA